MATICCTAMEQVPSCWVWLARVQLVSKMLGKELDDMADIKGESGGEAISREGAPVLEAQGLSGK